jgi:hypothetical protein
VLSIESADVKLQDAIVVEARPIAENERMLKPGVIEKPSFIAERTPAF